MALLCWLLPALGSAQRIDNLVSFRQIDQPSFSRLHYDNDFFTGTDYYYTQGYMLELVKPALQKNPLTKLLIKARGSQIQYGLAFKHFGFTPTSIRSQTPLR